MAQCQTCKQGIRWERRGEKWHALDEDGANHWSHCLGRGKSKKPRVLEIGPGRVVRGEFYTPSCWQCDLPAWESCACSALLLQRMAA